MKSLLDTNIILYLLGGKLAGSLGTGQYYVSVISEIELLSYPSLNSEAESQIRSFLSNITLVNLTQEVKESAIRLRRRHNLKLPDAIIAASALTLDAEILTNDLQLLRIPGIRTRTLPLIGS